MARKTKINLSALSQEEITSQIIQEVNAGIDKKVVANKFKVDLGTVFRICNRDKNRSNINTLAVIPEDQRPKAEVKQDLKQESVQEVSKEVVEKKEVKVIEVKNRKPKEVKRKTAKPKPEPAFKKKESISEKEEKPVIKKTTNKKAEPKKRKYTKITSEMKHAIIQEYFSEDNQQKMSQKDIAILYEISTTSVANIINEYKEFLNGSFKEQSNALNSQILAIPLSTGNDKIMDKNEFDPSKLKEMDNSDYISLGLVEGRHEMGVDQYIFQSFDQELMFDFGAQYAMAVTYLEANIPFKNGKPTKGVMLYATGLQSALTTVLTACMNLKIPTIVMHYNAESHTYFPQPYYEDKSITNSVPVQFNELLKKHSKVSLYDCTPEEVLNTEGKILEVVECWYAQPMGVEKRDIIKTECIVFINQEAAWDCFRRKSLEFVENKTIYLNYGEIIANRYVKGSGIARASN